MILKQYDLILDARKGQLAKVENAILGKGYIVAEVDNIVTRLKQENAHLEEEILKLEIRNGTMAQMLESTTKILTEYDEKYEEEERIKALEREKDKNEA